MVSDQEIIKKVCQDVPITVTFFNLVKHVCENYNVANWEDLNEDGKLTIFSKLNRYSDKKLNCLPRKRHKDLYHMLAIATFSENDEDPNEFVKIKEKTSRCFCFILKELVKPKHLVRSDSFSMFKKQVPKKDEDIYFLPNPNRYRNGIYDCSEIEIKTRIMREARERKRQSEEASKKRMNDLQKRRELKETGKLPVEKEEDSKADASMNWRRKATNDDERKKALRPVRYRQSQRGSNRC